MVEGTSGEVSMTATEETAASEVTPEKVPEKPDEFTDKFLRLTRRERALQQEAAALKAEKARIEAERKEIEEFRARKAKLAEDPLDALEYLGTSYDAITKAILRQGREPTAEERVAAVEEQLKEFQQAKIREAEERERAAKEAEEKSRQEYVSKFQAELETFIESSEYEMVKASKAYDLVVEIMQETYQKSQQDTGKGKLISYAQACEMAEEYLTEQVLELAKLNKVKAKLGISESSSPAQVNTPRVSGPTQTLTNSMRVATEPTTPSSRRPNGDELLKASAALIKWN